MSWIDAFTNGGERAGRRGALEPLHEPAIPPSVECHCRKPEPAANTNGMQTGASYQSQEKVCAPCRIVERHLGANGLRGAISSFRARV